LYGPKLRTALALPVEPKSGKKGKGKEAAAAKENA